MSGLVKGIKKAVKGIFKGIRKGFKKLTKSKLGKALLVAATIYLGGAALGAWKAVGAFSKVNGVLAAGKGSAAGAAAGNTATTVAGANVATPVVSNAALAKSAAATAAQTAGAAGAKGVAASTIGGMGKGSIIDTLMKGASKVMTFTNENPMAASMMVNAAAGALTPDQMDLQEQQQKWYEEERDRMNENMNVAGIDIGHAPEVKRPQFGFTRNTPQVT